MSNKPVASNSPNLMSIAVFAIRSICEPQSSRNIPVCGRSSCLGDMVKGICVACFVKEDDIDPTTGQKYKLDLLDRDALCKWFNKTHYGHLTWPDINANNRHVVCIAQTEALL